MRHLYASSNASPRGQQLNSSSAASSSATVLIAGIAAKRSSQTAQPARGRRQRDAENARQAAQADQQRGRFRSFLLSTMKNFMANEWHKARAQKRGGPLPALSLDEEAAEQRYRLEPVDQMTPETLFERGWALALLSDTLQHLEQEYARDGKTAWMQALRPALTADRATINYRQIAGQLDVTETAARVAVHRLRQRYRRLIQAEVAHTVTSPDQVEDEMRHLFQILAAR